LVAVAASQLDSLRASVTRLLVSALFSSGIVMIEPNANLTTARIRSRRAFARAAGDVARSWTGRSVVTSATDRARPRFATAGTHRTRVSETRLFASRTTTPRIERARTGPVTTPIQRRRPSAPLIISG
jgi:hypothetical protein